MLLVGAALVAPASADTKSAFSSRYAAPSQCKDVKRSPPDEDWIYMRCKGFDGIAVWYTCLDSARCMLGFGSRPNVSGMFGAERFGNWPVEWRGTVRHGRFIPFAAIIRASSQLSWEKATTLLIYRLRSNGTSCIIGETANNVAARRIADRSARKYKCDDEPVAPLTQASLSA
jgi:hypothetical protein